MKKRILWRMTAALLCLCLLAGCGGGSHLGQEPEQTSAPGSNAAPEGNASDGAQSSEQTGGEDGAAPTEENYYQVCTSFSAEEVEEYARMVRAQFLARDWKALSEALAYPITIDGERYEDSAAFLAADLDGAVGEDFLAALEKESCRRMFCSWQGIMLGSGGQVWIGETTDGEGSKALKVIEVNGMVGERKN